MCGVGLCWIDLWRGIGNGAQWALAVNCTGFCIFPMIALRLDWRMLLPNHKADTSPKKALKIVAYTWIALSAVLSYPAFKHFAPGTDYDAQIISAIANVILYGIIVIRMYFYLFHEKENSSLKLTPIFALWLAFMVLAIISVNKSVWPLWFMVMFGSFYLAPLSKDEMSELTEGLVNGLIIGFFIVQGRAFLYRPYDKDFRYYGHYTNPNVNAMFYLFTYVAWLVKLTILRSKKQPKRYALAFIFMSSMWVFVFFTGSRSAWLGFIGTTFVWLIIEARAYEQRFLKTVIGKGTLILIMAAVTFMPVFLCMRYIPPLRHHPIWYQSEYSEDRVMSWDPIDSEKYYELDEILPRMLGRFYSVRGGALSSEEAPEVVTTEPAASEAIIEETANTAEAFGITPIYNDTENEDTFLKKALGIRYFIYSYILSRVTFIGNVEFENVWLTDTFQLYHAHNTVLMILYWFGWFAGGIFLILLFLVPLLGIHNLAIKKKPNAGSPEYPAFLLAILATGGYLLIGITECVAFPGELGLTLFFISLLPMIRKYR